MTDTAVVDAPAVTITEPGMLERFFSQADRTGGPDACHPWAGNRTVAGYGRFRINGHRVYAHRWILGAQRSAPLRRDEFALHRCDNPPCVNPNHLYVGDQKQNMRDCIERGRANLTGLSLGRLPGMTRGRYRIGPERCGTVSGYSRHLRHGEATCQRCREAVNAYQRARRVTK